MGILPRQQFEIIKNFIKIFEELGVRYWLGGGLYNCIVKRDFQAITEAWNKSEHDIDFHILSSDKEIIDNNIDRFQALGFIKDGRPFPHKIVFSANRSKLNEIGRDKLIVEFPYLFNGTNDDYYFTAKKTQFYLPNNVFQNKRIQIKDLGINVPREDYVKIIYDTYKKN